MEENDGKKKDFFWLVIIVGVIVVTVGALFTGSRIAPLVVKWLGGEHSSQVMVSPADTSEEKSVIIEPRSRSGEIESVTADKKAGKPEKTAPKSAAAEKPREEKPKAQPPEPSEKPAAAIKPAGSSGSEIDISNAGNQSDKPAAGESDKKETAAPAPDAESVAVTPDDKTEPAADENVIYVLQLGVYSNRENALRMKKELEDEYKLSVYVAEVIYEGVKKYRVQAGAFKDKANAEKLGRELQIKGYKFYISKQPAPQ